jgi:hypothetical protein
MAKGDFITPLIQELGGRVLDETEIRKTGGARYELWGGLLYVRNKVVHEHTFVRGERIRGTNLVRVLDHAAEFRLDRPDNPFVKPFIDFGFHHRQARLSPRVALCWPEGFCLVGTTYPFQSHGLGCYPREEFPTAWALFLGMMDHGHWEPLIDHLLETDPDFQDKWARFRAAEVNLEKSIATT